MTYGLSDLKIGQDVPWVTSWSGEAFLGIRSCPTVRGRAAVCQAVDAGRGKPQYSRNHMLRQRLSVVRMLCPMCGEPTLTGDRWTEVATLKTAGALRLKGLALSTDIDGDTVLLDAGSIAPLHRRCVDRSLLHCPHLRGNPEVHVMKFPDRWTVIPLMIETDLIEGRQPEVVGFLQLCGITRTVDRRWRR